MATASKHGTLVVNETNTYTSYGRMPTVLRCGTALQIVWLLAPRDVFHGTTGIRTVEVQYYTPITQRARPLRSLACSLL